MVLYYWRCLAKLLINYWETSTKVNCNGNNSCKAGIAKVADKLYPYHAFLHPQISHVRKLHKEIHCNLEQPFDCINAVLSIYTFKDDHDEATWHMYSLKFRGCCNLYVIAIVNNVQSVSNYMVKRVMEKKIVGECK